MLSKFSGNEKFREPLIRRGWRSFHEITQLGNELINTDISILGCIKEVTLFTFSFLFFSFSLIFLFCSDINFFFFVKKKIIIY